MRGKSTGVYLSNTTNVTVQNLTVSNICQHTSASDTTGCQTGGNNDQAIKIVNGAVNLQLLSNTVHDSQKLYRN